jgi:hypothetical protein
MDQESGLEQKPRGQSGYTDRKGQEENPAGQLIADTPPEQHLQGLNQPADKDHRVGEPAGIAEEEVEKDGGQHDGGMSEQCFVHKTRFTGIN